MASCLACEARLAVAGLEVGAPVICDACGAEHEVLALGPLELVLVEDDEEALRSPASGEDEDDYDEDGAAA